MISPDGHYNLPATDQELVYVAQYEDGRQRTFTPAEFNKTCGWRNIPTKAAVSAVPLPRN